jgi:tRNA modification GTPase
MTTTAVFLTARGMGAIGVIQVAGAEAAIVVSRLALSKRLPAIGQAVHCDLVHPKSLEKADDGLIVRTGPQSFELQVHGGIAVMESVVEALKAAGAELVGTEEACTRGIFGRGIAGEVAVALTLAKTMTAARLLAAQINEGLTAWAEKWRAALHANPTGELWRFHSAAQWLMARSSTLRFLLQAPRVAIVGPPNAGKSTLANALLGRPVALTSEIAGTTRDWVDAQAIFVTGGVEAPVTLVDTAGLRETGDELEQESITRTHQQANLADAVILLFDGSRNPTPRELSLIEKYARCTLVVAINKIDLAANASAIENAARQTVRLSAKNGRGLDELMAAILRCLDLSQVAKKEAFAFTARQARVLSELVRAPDGPAAARLLNELVGTPA